MHTGLAVLLCTLLSPAVPPASVDPSVQEDLRFVRELRERGDADLALQFLQRLARNAPPQLASQLPLEMARTRLKIAAQEPDSSKRLAQYAQAQADFEKFLADAKGTTQPFEVQWDLAEVAVLRGRTQLSRALLQGASEARTAESAKARTLLSQAGRQLRQVARELDRRIEAAPQSTPQEKLARHRLMTDRLRLELTIGLNLFDQAQTISKTDGSNKVLLERAGLVTAARKILEPLGEKDHNNPIYWQAQAWTGRCDDDLGEPKKARARYALIQNAPAAIAQDGQRLARYFRMLLVRDFPEPGEKSSDLIIDAAARWLTDYPRHRNSLEGYGVRYLLAEAYLQRARATHAVDARAAARDLDAARRMVREIESTENDFTERAGRLKIAIIGEQGGFSRPVAFLTTFDDCYVRAQYEIAQIGQDASQIKDPHERESKRKQHLDTILDALSRALSMPEAQKPSPEVNSARALFAYYALNAHRYRDAARVGEEFARRDPRSPQAALAAMYALEAMGLDIARREREGAAPEEVRDDAQHLLELAAYMEKRWPTEMAGDVARYQAAVLLLHEKEPRYAEILGRLERITPTFPGFARSQWELAQAAFAAERDRAETLPGDKPGGYRARALAALARIPQPSADDPQAMHIWLLARARLTREMFTAGKFDEMQKSAENLLALLARIRASTDSERDQAIRRQLREEVEGLLLYAKYGLAEAAYKKGNYADVAGLLDPVVNDFNEGKLPAMRRNLQLGMVLLGLDLKANIQLGRHEPAQAVLKPLQTLTAEAGADAGSSAILGQLAVLIQQQVEELRKKGDKEHLDKAIANFTHLLGGIVKGTPNPAPKTVVQLARCYSNMDQHQKAAQLLAAVPTPRPGGDVNLYHGIRLLLVRELRLAQDLAQARTILDEIIGTKDHRGWGYRDISALKERVCLLEEDGDYGGAARLANLLVKQILPKVNTDNAMKEHYLEFYYHVAYAFYKNAQTLSDPAQKEKAIREAARQVVELEQKWDNFGSEASKKRFEDLLSREAPLREQYEHLKAARPGAAQGVK